MDARLGLPLRISSGIGRGRSTVSIVLIAILLIFGAVYALRRGIPTNQSLFFVGILWPFIWIPLAPLLSSVTVTSEEVRRSSWPFGSRSMRLDEIASVERTRVVHLTRTGSVANSYLTVISRDEAVAPFDIRVDFYKPADVKALWRACGGTGSFEDGSHWTVAKRSPRRAITARLSGGASPVLSDRVFRGLSTLGGLLMAVAVIPALFSHPPNLPLMVWAFFVFTISGTAFELLAGRIGDRTIVPRSDHPDIYWSKISEDVSLVIGIGAACFCVQFGLLGV